MMVVNRSSMKHRNSVEEFYETGKLVRPSSSVVEPCTSHIQIRGVCTLLTPSVFKLIIFWFHAILI